MTTNLNLQCGECQISTSRGGTYKVLDVDLTDVDTAYLNSAEVAKHIDISLFVDTHGEEKVIEYLRVNYPDYFEQ